jgi:hypothetical protein
MHAVTVAITSLAFVGSLAASLTGRSTRNGNPEGEFTEKTEFVGMPDEFNSMSTGKVLLVRRFDRGADGTRVHVDGFAQLFGRYPSEKYTLRTSVTDAALAGSFRGLASSCACGGVAAGECECRPGWP